MSPFSLLNTDTLRIIYFMARNSKIYIHVIDQYHKVNAIFDVENRLVLIFLFWKPV